MTKSLFTLVMPDGKEYAMVPVAPGWTCNPTRAVVMHSDLDRDEVHGVINAMAGLKLGT